MRYAYAALLRLYPNSYRGAFGAEMALVFEQATGDYRPRGFLAYLAFLYSEFFGVIAGAFSLWADEYLIRSRRRMRLSFVISLLAGATLAALSDACVIAQVGHLGRHDFMRAQVPDATQVMPDRGVILWLFCGALLFVALFSVAFVWNLRNIRNHSGVTKPIRETRARRNLRQR